jgi:hypothetical protein
LVEDADGEVLGRIEARTSIPIVAPFRRDIQTALRKQILDVAGGNWWRANEIVIPLPYPSNGPAPWFV